MEQVLGIGGVFFKARDPKALAAWYREHLGLPIEPEQTYGTLTSAAAGEQTLQTEVVDAQTTGFLVLQPLLPVQVIIQVAGRTSHRASPQECRARHSIYALRQVRDPPVTYPISAPIPDASFVRGWRSSMPAALLVP